MKNVILLCFVFFAFETISVNAQNQNSAQKEFFDFMGKPAVFESNNLKASVYGQGSRVWVDFTSGANSSSSEFLYFVPISKDKNGNNLNTIEEPSGFFYQDGDKKIREFITTFKGHDSRLSLFLNQNNLLAPVLYAVLPPPASRVERKFSKNLNQDYFVFYFPGNKKMVYFMKNGFLILKNNIPEEGKDNLLPLDVENEKLCSDIEHADWSAAIFDAEEIEKKRATSGIHSLIPALYVEEGDFSSAIKSYLQFQTGESTNPFPEYVAMANEAVGDQLEVDGKISVARNYYQTALTLIQGMQGALNDREKRHQINYGGKESSDVAKRYQMSFDAKQKLINDLTEKLNSKLESLN